MTQGQCPGCGSRELYYVQHTIEYHNFEASQWPTTEGLIDLIALDDSWCDDGFEPFVLCRRCQKRWCLDGTPFTNTSVPVTLAAEDWAEVMNALESKALLVERGDYGEGDVEGSEFDPEAWARHLRAIYARLEPVLKAAGINF